MRVVWSLFLQIQVWIYRILYIFVRLTLINISWSSGEVFQDFEVLQQTVWRRGRRRWRPGWLDRRSRPRRTGWSSSPCCGSWFCWFWWFLDLTWQMSLQTEVRCWGRAWTEKYYNLKSSHTRPLNHLSFSIYYFITFICSSVTRFRIFLN